MFSGLAEAVFNSVSNMIGSKRPRPDTSSLDDSDDGVSGIKAARLCVFESVSAHYRVGMWLPSDETILFNWIKKLTSRVEDLPEYKDARKKCQQSCFDEQNLTCELEGLHPPVRELKEIIENDPVVNIFFHQMFTQARECTSCTPAKTYCDMLFMINTVIREAPEFNKTGMVGCPITAIVAWEMGTNAGFSGFLNEKVNQQFKKILNYWAQFLKSKDSRYVISDHPKKGWLGRDAMEAMPNFIQTYKCNPKQEHFGFVSWDQFFTRELCDGVRPVARDSSNPRDDHVIANACESAPYNIKRNVQLRSRFWVKSQHYSLIHMLANDPLTESFVGGTVYQAFLSSKNYHRWHSPVDGKILKTYVIDGSYFAQLQFLCSEGLKLQNQSQGFITEVATRALIFIEADNPNIGLMCFIAVGMVEVSSCEITVYHGQRVEKGQQLGMFHYGGSTHCLIFRPGIKIKFHLQGQEPGLHAKTFNVNSKIATVERPMPKKQV